MGDTDDAAMSPARAIICPACGGSIAIKAVGYSVTVACQYCGSTLDVANPDVQLITRYHEAAGAAEIPLGSRGELFGVEWEAIGYLERSDSDASWTEFLLFNPYAGYRWLIFSDGAWQVGTMLLDRPVNRGGEMVRWNQRLYRQDHATLTTITDRVVGEFYWRVEAGDQVMACTYSAQDNTVLSLERSRDEVNWTHLRSVTDEKVRGAFGLPEPEKPHIVQRFAEDFSNASAMHDRDLIYMFLMAIASAVVIFVIMGGFALGTPHFDGQANVFVNAAERNVTLGTIRTDLPYRFVTVDVISSEFSNRWVDLDYSLVNRETGQSIDAYSVVERYNGQDSDGPWTEGDYSAHTLFAGVPRGTYDLTADLSAHQWSQYYESNSATGEEIGLWFKAYSGGMSWGNFWLLVIPLFLPPVCILWWRKESRD